MPTNDSRASRKGGLIRAAEVLEWYEAELRGGCTDGDGKFGCDDCPKAGGTEACKLECDEIAQAAVTVREVAALSENAPALNEVWAVSNKTSLVLFESQEMARAYVSQFGAATSGGMSITNMAVFRSPSER